jgi:hypothetical protein
LRNTGAAHQFLKARIITQRIEARRGDEASNQLPDRPRPFRLRQAVSGFRNDLCAGARA